MKYYLITGFDNGEPIKPYIVLTDADSPDLSHFYKVGDSVRYYEPISRDEAIEHIANGIDLL